MSSKQLSQVSFQAKEQKSEPLELPPQACYDGYATAQPVGVSTDSRTSTQGTVSRQRKVSYNITVITAAKQTAKHSSPCARRSTPALNELTAEAI